tara:strand:+ start:217 stop:909 length:693 start_codon:yes stop_codon:yes gene_type:complete
MNELNIKYIFCIILSISFLASQSRKEKSIINFIEARYSANTDSVKLFLDDKFIYYHIPFVGLGINTKSTNNGLAVIGSVSFNDTNSILNIGDVIIEINGLKINNINKYNIENIIKGSAGDSIKVTYIRDDETFLSMFSLSKQQYKQGSESFITDIENYGERWFEYDLEILDIFSKKNQFIVYYEWEGILFENGPAYSYRSMEIIKINTSNNRVYSIDALWSEKQFKDQFK